LILGRETVNPDPNEDNRPRLNFDSLEAYIKRLQKIFILPPPFAPIDIETGLQTLSQLLPKLEPARKPEKPDKPEKMVKCRLCGAEIPENFKFCPNCGSELRKQPGFDLRVQL